MPGGGGLIPLGGGPLIGPRGPIPGGGLMPGGGRMPVHEKGNHWSTFRNDHISSALWIYGR